MKKVQYEQKEQEAVVKWFKLCHPRLAKCITASANGGRRDAIEGARLKKMGVLAGEPDLFISLIATPIENKHTKFLAGLYIEMKYGKGKISKEQQEIIDLRVASGYQVAVCYDADDAIKVIKDYLKAAVLPGSIEAEQLRTPNRVIEETQLNQVPEQASRCVLESQELQSQTLKKSKSKAPRRKKA